MRNTGATAENVGPCIELSGFQKYNFTKKRILKVLIGIKAMKIHSREALETNVDQTFLLIFCFEGPSYEETITLGISEA